MKFSALASVAIVATVYSSAVSAGGSTNVGSCESSVKKHPDSGEQFCKQWMKSPHWPVKKDPKTVTYTDKEYETKTEQAWPVTVTDKSTEYKTLTKTKTSTVETDVTKTKSKTVKTKVTSVATVTKTKPGKTYYETVTVTKKKGSSHPDTWGAAKRGEIAIAGRGYSFDFSSWTDETISHACCNAFPQKWTWEPETEEPVTVTTTEEIKTTTTAAPETSTVTDVKTKTTKVKTYTTFTETKTFTDVEKSTKTKSFVETTTKKVKGPKTTEVVTVTATKSKKNKHPKATSTTSTSVEEHPSHPTVYKA